MIITRKNSNIFEIFTNKELNTGVLLNKDIENKLYIYRVDISMLNINNDNEYSILEKIKEKYNINHIMKEKNEYIYILKRGIIKTNINNKKIEDIGYNIKTNILHKKDDIYYFVEEKTEELIKYMYNIGYDCNKYETVKETDIIKEKYDTIELKDEQKIYYNNFLKYGKVGLFLEAGFGKTFISLKALATIKGSHLILVPTLQLKRQWEERIEKYAVKNEYNNIEIIAYNILNYRRYIKNKYSLIIFDEVHHLPAPRYKLWSRLDHKYRIGLSATPYREDGNDYLIYHFSGKSLGSHYNQKKIDIEIKVFDEEEDKLFYLMLNINRDKKNVIFCERIKDGFSLAEELDCNFYYSKNNSNLEYKNNLIALSRIGDEGVSLTDADVIYEYSGLGKSRRQAIQRITRLNHSNSKEKKYYILFSREEYDKYKDKIINLYNSCNVKIDNNAKIYKS